MAPVGQSASSHTVSLDALLPGSEVGLFILSQISPSSSYFQNTPDCEPVLEMVSWAERCSQDLREAGMTENLPKVGNESKTARVSGEERSMSQRQVIVELGRNTQL